MKVTIKGFIFANRPYRNEKVTFSFAEYDRAQYDSEYVLVCPHEMEVEVPEGFDIRHGLVANLTAQKTKVRAEAEAKVTNIDRHIQTLLAIENEPGRQA